MSRIAITGAPSSGKTTICRELFRRGMRIIPEAARLLLETNIYNPLLGYDELNAFEQDAFKLHMFFEDIAPPDKVVFFDNGIHTYHAYYLVHGYDVPAGHRLMSDALEYDKVFMFDMLPYYHDDVRIYEDERRVLDELIRNIYEWYGYRLIKVPVFSENMDENVEMRTDFICEEVFDDVM